MGIRKVMGRCGVKRKFFACYTTNLKSAHASAAAMHGPTTGIHAYPHSDEPLPEMGKIACAILGARSRAGLIAYPVVPPI